MARMLLLDGPALVYRSHFALAKSNLTDSAGRNTAATYGYTSTLLKLLREQKPDYVCVAFDTEEPTFRHELFEEYKADRPGMPDDLAAQLGWIKEVTRVLGLHILEAPGYEADDIIATLARRARREDIEVVIATGDKDMLQVVDDGTKVIMLSGWGRDTQVMDERAVRAKFGIRPALLADYFALMGDAIDNVRGVPGIGKKTARMLVDGFGGLEAIYANVDQVTPARVREALTTHRDAAFASRDLVELKTGVPLDPTIADLSRAPVDEVAARDLFTRLGFRSLLAQVLGGGTSIEVSPTVWYGSTPERPASGLACPEGLAVEANIDGPTACTCRVLGVAVACEGAGEHYFPLHHREPDNIGESDFSRMVADVMSDPGIAKVVHDGKRTALAMRGMGIDLEGIEFDTQIAAYLLNPGQGGQQVDTIVAEHLGRTLGAGAGNAAAGGATIKQASALFCGRVRAVLEARQVMEAALRNRGLWQLYTEVELPLSRVLADMEFRGVRVNREHLGNLSSELDKKTAHLETECFALAGRTFNLNSPRDISHILFEEIGLRPRRRTKTGYSTDTSVLMELSAEHDLPRLILEHRHLANLKSTYVDQLLRFADRASGRIHAVFHQCVAATGRLSSSDPNLQNIPIRTETGAEIRKAFIPSGPGWLLLSADYSQIELRIVAHLSEDPALIEAFESGEDIHRSTAAFVFKVRPEAVSPAMRAIAKSVNFGIIYGMGAQSLARAANLNIQEAGRFLEEHKRTYPRLYEYIQASLRSAQELGYVETVLGRKRFLPQIASKEPGVRSAAERMAVNTPVQGSAADIMKTAMLGIHREVGRNGLAGGLVIQVHDEVVIDCPGSEVPTMDRIVREKMSGAFDLRVPLKVDVKTGRNWYEAHA